jgi:hypothetical protein
MSKINPRISMRAYIAAIAAINGTAPMAESLAAMRHSSFIDALRSGWTTNLADAECVLFLLMKNREPIPSVLSRTLRWDEANDMIVLRPHGEANAPQHAAF